MPRGTRLRLSSGHPLASKEILGIEDLAGQKVLVNQRGWNSVTDAVTDDLRASVVPVEVEEYEFINVDMFNRCEKEGCDDFTRQLIGSNRAGARLIACPSRMPQLD